MTRLVHGVLSGGVLMATALAAGATSALAVRPMEINELASRVPVIRVTRVRIEADLLLVAPEIDGPVAISEARSGLSRRHVASCGQVVGGAAPDGLAEC